MKRPTTSADLLPAAEKRHGARLLGEKLETVQAAALIFPFKAAAVELIGRFVGNGCLSKRFLGSQLFVMPGPYESAAIAARTIATLRSGLD